MRWYVLLSTHGHISHVDSVIVANNRKCQGLRYSPFSYWSTRLCIQPRSFFWFTICVK